MEAIIKFNLPEDEEDFQVAVNGKKMYSVLWEMDQWLHNNQICVTTAQQQI